MEVVTVFSPDDPWHYYWDWAVSVENCHALSRIAVLLRSARLPLCDIVVKLFPLRRGVRRGGLNAESFPELSKNII
jgi:hypothetical protein